MIRHDTSTPSGCREALREIFPLNATVTTMITYSTPRSAVVAVTVIAVIDGQPYNASWLVARAMGWRLHGKVMGIKIGAMGLRRTHWVAHELMAALHGRAHAGHFTLNDLTQA